MQKSKARTFAPYSLYTEFEKPLHGAEFVDFVLDIDEFRVLAVLLHEFIMGSKFGHFAALHAA